jgi:RNA polymerase sigma-70 factor, ECF subfamily
MAISDNDLIVQARNGSDFAFEQLVHRYDRQVFSIAANYVRSSEDAKDIYQEVLIRIYKGLPKFEFRSEFSTWLFRIATNVCLTHRTNNRKHKYISLDEPPNEDEEYHTHTRDLSGEDKTDQRILDKEISKNIQNALQYLSPQQKLVFTLRHFQEFKLKEIAEMMNCSEGTVKKYLFTAVQKMRTELKEIK